MRASWRGIPVPGSWPPRTGAIRGRTGRPILALGPAARPGCQGRPLRPRPGRSLAWPVPVTYRLVVDRGGWHPDTTMGSYRVKPPC